MNNDSKPYFSIVDLFCALLTVALVTLRLCGVIDWPWYMIFAPILLPICLGIVAALIVTIYMFQHEDSCFWDDDDDDDDDDDWIVIDCDADGEENEGCEDCELKGTKDCPLEDDDYDGCFNWDEWDEEDE